MSVRNQISQTFIIIFNAIFGEFHTYEGDPFYWLVNWGTMLYRTDLLRLTSGFTFWFLNHAIVLMIVFAYLSNAEIEAIGEYLATLSVLCHVAVVYGVTIRNFQTIRKFILLVKRLSDNWKRPMKKVIVEEMKSFGKLTRKISIACSLISAVFYTLYATLEKNSGNIGFVIINLFPYSQYLTILFLGFIMPPALIFFVYVPIFLTCYVSFHVIFRLKVLNAYVNDLMDFESHCYIIESLDSREYQKKIAAEISFISGQLSSLQGLINYYNKSTKWRLLILTATGGVAMATIMSFALAVRSIQSIIHLSAVVCGIFMVFVSTECGQQIQNQCEKLHVALQHLKWYQWSQENCRSLLMLLLQTKNPFELKCYGFVIQNRNLFLSLYRIIHTYMTYYQSIQ